MSTHENPNPVPEWTIAHRLVMAREHAGLKQAELATATGISRRTISAYEDPRHEGARSMRNLRDLAAGCGVPLGWILTGSEDRGPDDGGVVDLTARRIAVTQREQEITQRR